MAALRHDNVARIEGICVSPPCLLTEYCAHRSLKDVLAAAAADSELAGVLTWKLRMRMVRRRGTPVQRGKARCVG